MDGQYDILMGREPVGTVTVERQGLYYRFCCRCRLTGDVICRVVVECGGHHENLGILVPMDKQFGLTTKLAVKKLGKGPMQFRVIPKHPSGQGLFVRVYPEEPFAYLSRLKDAFLEVRDGQAGIVIPQL